MQVKDVIALLQAVEPLGEELLTALTNVIEKLHPAKQVEPVAQEAQETPAQVVEPTPEVATPVEPA